MTKAHCIYTRHINKKKLSAHMSGAGQLFYLGNILTFQKATQLLYLFQLIFLLYTIFLDILHFKQMAYLCK